MAVLNDFLKARVHDAISYTQPHSIAMIRKLSLCSQHKSAKESYDTNALCELAFRLKLQLHDAIYQLRFYSNSLIHILSLSTLHNNVASIQKNRGDNSHRVIVA